MFLLTHVRLSDVRYDFRAAHRRKVKIKRCKYSTSQIESARSILVKCSESEVIFWLAAHSCELTDCVERAERAPRQRCRVSPD